MRTTNDFFTACTITELCMIERKRERGEKKKQPHLCSMFPLCLTMILTGMTMTNDGARKATLHQSRIHQDESTHRRCQNTKPPPSVWTHQSFPTHDGLHIARLITHLAFLLGALGMNRVQRGRGQHLAAGYYPTPPARAIVGKVPAKSGDPL